MMDLSPGRAALVGSGRLVKLGGPWGFHGFVVIFPLSQTVFHPKRMLADGRGHDHDGENDTVVVSVKHAITRYVTVDFGIMTGPDRLKVMIIISFFFPAPKLLVGWPLSFSVKFSTS